MFSSHPFNPHHTPELPISTNENIANCKICCKNILSVSQTEFPENPDCLRNSLEFFKQHQEIACKNITTQNTRLAVEYLYLNNTSSWNASDFESISLSPLCWHFSQFRPILTLRDILNSDHESLSSFLSMYQHLRNIFSPN